MDEGFREKIVSWCHEVRNYPGPKEYYCPADDDLITVARHNYRFNQRVEGIPSGPRERLSCAHYCRPWHAFVIGHYQYDDIDVPDSLVHSVVACHCPRFRGLSPVPPPPTVGEYRESLRKYGNWEALANYDRHCGGRGDLKVATHNARLLGRRCFSRGHDKAMSCPEGQVDYCTLYPYPDAVGAVASFWKHDCIGYLSSAS